MSIEDKMLKKNIPGKYSWWDDQDDKGKEGAASDASEDEAPRSELEEARATAAIPEPLRRAYHANRLRAKGNTGVKGVMEDYKEWRRDESQLRELEAQLRTNALRRAAFGAVGEEVDSQAVLQHIAQLRDDSGDDDVEEEDADEAFMQKYRAQRLQQLRSAAAQPTFGDIAEVSSASFLDAVEKIDPRTFVVVHLYEPYIQPCTRMNRALEKLARQRPEVRFLRMRAEECRLATGQTFDTIALPTLIVYKGGETRASIVRVQDEIGEELRVDAVEWLLELEGVFQQLLSPTGARVGGAGAIVGEYGARDARNVSGETVNATAHFRDAYEAVGGISERDARLADFSTRVSGPDPLAEGKGASRWAHLDDVDDDDFADEADEPLDGA